MIVSVFKRLPGKVIEYRIYKTFDQNEFLRNFDQELIKGNDYTDEQQHISTSFFRKELDEYAPFKTKKLRGSQAKFMTNELKKTIMDQSTISHKNY